MTDAYLRMSPVGKLDVDAEEGEEDEEIKRRAIIRQGDVKVEGDEEVVVLRLDDNNVVDDDIGVERQMSSDSGALEMRSQSSDVSMVVILTDVVGKGAIEEDISKGEDFEEANDSSITRTKSEVRIVDANGKSMVTSEEGGEKEFCSPGSRDGESSLGKVRTTMC